MSEQLKVGDKVTHSLEAISGEFEVTSLDSLHHHNSSVRVVDSKGAPHVFTYGRLVKVAKHQPGDRVRAERSGPTGTSPRGDWVEGVVQSVGLEQTNELLLKKDDGHRVFVYADTAEKAKTPKTNYAVGTRLIVTGDTGNWYHSFAPGTEVTVTLTGRGGRRGGGYREGTFGYGVESVADGVYWDVNEDDLQVAPKPKPFAVGTVVKTRLADAPLVKTRAGWKWRGEEPSTIYTTDAEVRAEIAKSKDFSLVYEPALT